MLHHLRTWIEAIEATNLPENKEKPPTVVQNLIYRFHVATHRWTTNSGSPSCLFIQTSRLTYHGGNQTSYLRGITKNSDFI